MKQVKKVNAKSREKVTKHNIMAKLEIEITKKINEQNDGARRKDRRQSS